MVKGGVAKGVWRRGCGEGGCMAKGVWQNGMWQNGVWQGGVVKGLWQRGYGKRGCGKEGKVAKRGCGEGALPHRQVKGQTLLWDPEADTPLRPRGRHPFTQRQTPPRPRGRHHSPRPRGRQPPWHTLKRAYASYWNAFLFSGLCAILVVHNFLLPSVRLRMRSNSLFISVDGPLDLS